jgi:hypothetical protein
MSDQVYGLNRPSGYDFTGLTVSGLPGIGGSGIPNSFAIWNTTSTIGASGLNVVGGDILCAYDRIINDRLGLTPIGGYGNITGEANSLDVLGPRPSGAFVGNNTGVQGTATLVSDCRADGAVAILSRALGIANSGRPAVSITSPGNGTDFIAQFAAGANTINFRENVIDTDVPLKFNSGLPSFANNAAAIGGGLTAGDLYEVTASDPRQIAIVF